MKRRILSMIIALVMCFALLVTMCACADDNQTAQTETVAETQAQAVDPLWETATYLEDITLGEGETTIDVEVVAGEKSITVTINTDAKNLEDALVGVDLVQGDDSEYGLYIKTVNGILADYDVDQSYWSINKDGEYLMEGANATEITAGEHYELVYTK